uniref:Piwi domain-containing protein n=1 Tax=Panagrolaimus sp. PS1159 TaxID=55785 RepID=A0AC35FH61_9BILA
MYKLFLLSIDYFVFLKLVLHKLSDHGRCPDKLIIFRNGCCEGQFKRVLSKVTVVVPNRMHNLRFMLDNANPQMRPPEQNVKPGKIVDTVVVHPSYNEFYLNPHVALQGTAKTPRFA